MYVEIEDTGQAAVRDVANLRELKILAPGIHGDQISSALEAAGWGTLDGGHAWLPVAALRDAGAGRGPTWDGGFEQMIAYAASQGWISEDGLRVRAHLEQ